MRGQIRVINKATMTARLPMVKVYVGRPAKGEVNSKLANPFPIVRDTEAQRDDVTARFEAWLLERLAKEGHPVQVEFLALVERVRKGEHIALACYCAPKKCHADIIKKYLEQYLENTP